MQTYTDKLQELGVEALEENKDAIKKAMTDSLIEIIRKSPQLLERLVDDLLSGASNEEGD